MVRPLTYLFLGLLFSGLTGFAQEEEIQQKLMDSIAVKKNIKELQQEQKELNFQTFFFKALRQKAIGNYDKALEALEQCQNIREDDLAVIFEISKNYFAQEKYFEAIAFVEKALTQQPENLYLLEHLKDIYVRQKDYKKALDLQLKIVDKKPQNQADLIILYIRNNRIEDARQLLVDLEKNGLLSESLVPFKDSLFPNNSVTTETRVKPELLQNQSLEELKASYVTKKTFPVLKEILSQEFDDDQFLDLEKDSKEGLDLFPAQPFVYLMHGKALNKLKKYGEAIPYLKNGLDYVIDDPEIEADFYEELSLSFKGLRKNIEASKYYNMALKKRQKKS
ncbi:MAG: hypothetical protein QNJ57_12945 [Flavobacteriaceae bacterium]|nr:hypothetical protein [Flavobacteriaceae bacterium]